MEHSIVRKTRFLPSVVVSVFLLAMAFAATRAEASPVNLPAQQPVQLAWWGGWGGGWHHGWGGGWNRGWGGGSYCHCWINRWGYQRCNCN